jgi:hypothetical protein
LSPRKRGASTSLGWVVAAAVGAAAACGDANAPSPRFWTVEQAESIRTVRGTPLTTTRCTGIGAARDGSYPRFSCVGKVVPPTMPDRPVRVRYVLNPRGRYDGRGSAYLATDVHFDAFGVP